MMLHLSKCVRGHASIVDACLYTLKLKLGRCHHFNDNDNYKSEVAETGNLRVDYTETRNTASDTETGIIKPG
eukprot:2605731-Pleurochrysis_carterae.AAC.1